MQAPKSTSFDDQEHSDSSDSLSGKNVSDEESFANQIDAINEEAIALMENNDQQQALQLLQKAEKMLDFLANCGKPIDRNLIVVVLYNEASVYQKYGITFKKCQKFMDGVIFNVELLVNEKPNPGQLVAEYQLVKIKRLSFLAKAYLQYCAVLSQLGQHESSLEIAKKSVKILIEMFTLSESTCKGLQKSESMLQRTRYQSTKDGNMVIEEIQFKQLLIKTAVKFLQQINENLNCEVHDEKQQLLAAQRQVYYWKNNPENNEKHLREQLNVRMKSQPNDLRSLLGVQNELEWIEQFNIGTIMHISPIQYSQFALQGELLYEFSRKILLEKILYLSISYFTIATEMRFIEIDKNKNAKAEQYQNSHQFKLSVLYHLKAIEIACKHVQCMSPYIDHLIGSFYKHYNQSLEPIAEESYVSQADHEPRRHLGVKSQKSYSDHTKGPEKGYLNEVELISTALLTQQNRKLVNRKTEEEFDIIQKKKLSLEGLKHVLQSLQQKAAQNALNTNRLTSAGTRNQTESASITKSRDRTLRCETDVVEKSSLKALSIGQLKKLKQRETIVKFLELECKKKPSSQWNKSLNHLLTVGNIKRKSQEDSTCKTERSQEENKKIQKSYAVAYPKVQQIPPQPQSSSATYQSITNSINRPLSESQDDPQKTSQQRSLKSPTQLKPKLLSAIRNPQTKPKSYINQINIINSNTLNINNGQNFITVKPDNKQFKSKSNYQTTGATIQQRSPLQKSKVPLDNGVHINMKMETIQMLLQKGKPINQQKF